MGLYIGSTVINTRDLQKGIAFWTAALGYQVRNAGSDFAVLADPNRRWSNLSLQLTTEPKISRNRLHLDLYATAREAEAERLEGLGATRPEWEYEEDDDFIVLADPDGNEFCVVQSSFLQE